MTRYFCTYFDNNYLLYSLALYRSLKETGIHFRLYAACLDEAAYDNLQRLSLPEVHPIRIADIEAHDPQFAACKSNRSKVEYYFTLSPVLPLYLFDTCREIDILGYLDSDLYFFSSPEPIYENLGDNSLLIFEHGFAQEQDEVNLYGKFNVAFQLYRNDTVGRQCLSWWRDRCLEWCFDYPEDGKFADQKYLDDWPTLFPGVVVARNRPGVALAPWNWMEHDLKLENGTLKVDGGELVFYHYQGFKFLNWQIVYPGLAQWLLAMPDPISDHFHRTYYRAIRRAARQSKAEGLHFSFLRKLPRSETEKHPTRFQPAHWWGKFKKKFYLSGLKRLLIGEYLFRGSRTVLFPKQAEIFRAQLKRNNEEKIS